MPTNSQNLAVGDIVRLTGNAWDDEMRNQEFTIARISDRGEACFDSDFLNDWIADLDNDAGWEVAVVARLRDTHSNGGFVKVNFEDLRVGQHFDYNVEDGEAPEKCRVITALDKQRILYTHPFSVGSVFSVDDDDADNYWVLESDLQPSILIDTDELPPVTNLDGDPLNDPVNHPAHYTRGGIEVIDFIEAYAPDDFHRANALKYIARAGEKDPTKFVEDLEKAVWYLNRRIAQAKAAS